MADLTIKNANWLGSDGRFHAGMPAGSDGLADVACGTGSGAIKIDVGARAG